MIQYNTIWYNTIQYNAIQYNTLQCNAIQYNTLQCNTIQYNTKQCSEGAIILKFSKFHLQGRSLNADIFE